MYYPYSHSYPWGELYYRFLSGKIELADWRFNKRWDDLWVEPDSAIDDLDDDRHWRLCAIRNLCFAMHRRRLRARRHPPFDAIVHDLAVNDLATVARLGDDLRAARANLPPGWLTAAVAITLDATPTMQQLAQQHEVHLITCHGLHTPYRGPIPPAFRNPRALTADAASGEKSNAPLTNPPADPVPGSATAPPLSV